MTLVNPEQDLGTSVLAIPQQFLAGERVDHDVEYKLGRACTAHCAAAVPELMGGASQTSVTELIDFVMEHGAESGSSLYTDGKGWNLIGIADLLRLNGHPVVSQNLHYNADTTDIRTAAERRRVTTEYEKTRLVLYRERGGSDRSRWMETLEHTLLFGGVAVTSIEIPLLSGEGYGLHAVVVTDVDEELGRVSYFDPDYYNIRRYGSRTPSIHRVDDHALIYQRPIEDHLSVMTGEVMHVFPPRFNYE